MVNQHLVQNQPELAERALRLLEHQLYQVGRVLPAQSSWTVRTVTIWVEENECSVRPA